MILSNCATATPAQPPVQQQLDSRVRCRTGLRRRSREVSSLKCDLEEEECGNELGISSRVSGTADASNATASADPDTAADVEEEEEQQQQSRISCNAVATTTMGAKTQTMRMRLAFGVIVRLFLPLINGMANGIRSLKVLRLPRNYHANRSLFTNLFAHAANTLSMSLSSVQVVHRIDPWLKKITFRKPPATSSSCPAFARLDSCSDHGEWSGNVRMLPMLPAFEEAPEKSVTLNVVYEPPKNVAIRADVVFVHGLHGSLVNTWKQGMWNSEGRRVKFERPPRPPVRPPKRPRHSRRLDAPHQFKRPRHFTMGHMDSASTAMESSSGRTKAGSPASSMAGSRPESPHERSDIENLLQSACLEAQAWPVSRDMTYYCDEPEITETIDELEYSFPTFRTMVPEEGGHSWITAENGGATAAGTGRTRRKKFVKTADYSPCWPRDWLPKNFPDLRVIALNYTTDPYLWRPVWIKKRNRTSLTERAREMTDMLIEKGVGVNHPIIWVGHSKGGLFIKQIIVDAWESGRPAAEPLWRSSRGTFFYSVPHRGSPLADFNLPLLRQSIELLEIQRNCPSILDLHRRFVALYHKGHLKVKVFSFVETALTLMSVLYLRIVGVDSADPGIGNVCGVHLDHREICKPRSQECILYLELVKMIESVS